ncbi:MAG: DUF1003 domain-containing protein [Candidatus Parcubacteria bacterium]|nr:DUF1003 domain-containing protein [Leptolyngbyaceae cyanobacterium LF-bin-113]
MLPAELPEPPQVSLAEYQLLLQLRKHDLTQNPLKRKATTGERLADRVAATVGSWRFIIIQSILLALWITLNLIAWVQHWDPYPFILLNLALSFQAAYSAPIIMMSQNRQSDLDRADMRQDCEVNLKAEIEIELLHDKLNLLRDRYIPEILAQLQRIEERLEQR